MWSGENNTSPGFVKPFDVAQERCLSTVCREKKRATEQVVAECRCCKPIDQGVLTSPMKSLPNLMHMTSSVISHFNTFAAGSTFLLRDLAYNSQQLRVLSIYYEFFPFMERLVLSNQECGDSVIH
jgi:hypothetical protein